ncbi:MAG TPA: hypothetical protein VM866_12495 [Pyrinomonadaceae bacterium]|jgi:hypothetical protein|nr:hypothetical protein [Pyrinomonadaceae bacterium]
MNRMRAGAIVRRVHRTLLSVAFVIAFAAGASGQTKRSVVVEHVAFSNFPVEVTRLEVAGVPHYFLEHPQFKFTGSFDAPEDWLKRLAFSVKNKTDKTIVAITLQGGLVTAAEGDVPMSFKVRFGRELDESAFTGRAPHGDPRQLSPGETANMQWTVEEYDDLVKFLALKHPVVSYREMYFELNEVRFDDGKVWVQGNLYRIDPRDPRKWTPLDGKANDKALSPLLNAGERVIVARSLPSRPGDDVLEVVNIKVAGQSVTPGRPFTADEEWLRNLSVRIKNTSPKPIESIRLQLSLPEARYRAGGLGISLNYGGRTKAEKEAGDIKPLMPGGEAELKFTAADYESNQKFVSERSSVSSFSRLVFGQASVNFEDGTRGVVWNLIRAPNAPEQSGAKR